MYKNLFDALWIYMYERNGKFETFYFSKAKDME